MCFSILSLFFWISYVVALKGINYNEFDDPDCKIPIGLESKIWYKAGSCRAKLHGSQLHYNKYTADEDKKEVSILFHCSDSECTQGCGTATDLLDTCLPAQIGHGWYTYTYEELKKDDPTDWFHYVFMGKNDTCTMDKLMMAEHNIGRCESITDRMSHKVYCDEKNTLIEETWFSNNACTGKSDRKAPRIADCEYLESLGISWQQSCDVLE